MHGPLGIILSARWGAYSNQERLSRLSRIETRTFFLGEESLRHTLRVTTAWARQQDVPVGVIGQVPELLYSAPICLLVKPRQECDVSLDREVLYMRPERDIFAKLSETSGVLFFDPVPSLCASGRCRLFEGGTLLYRDDHHLSRSGALALEPLLADFVISMKAKLLAQGVEVPVLAAPGKFRENTPQKSSVAYP